MECLFNAQSENVVAYCNNPKHSYGMTVKQMKCKNCLGKQCRHLIKNEEHDYWRQREQAKQHRQARKKAINEYIDSLQKGGNVECYTTNS